MTAQTPENLLHRGKRFAMHTTPLEDYFDLGGVRPHFEVTRTTLWRGYIGDWEVVDDHLYLARLKGELEDGSQASLATVFPEFPDRVFAHWYNGTLRLPQGRRLKYVHQGFHSTFEQDLLIDIERGVIVLTRTRDNGLTESASAPAGAQGGGITTRAAQSNPDQARE